MAMLRVSSYRKLFEQDAWSRNAGLRMQSAGRDQASRRGAAVDKCDCDTFDFVAAKSLGKDGLNRLVQDRTIIAALNDRLVKLIELARWFEVENEFLECQIVELEEQLNSRPASSITPTVAEPDYTLDAVLETLRKQRDEILCDSKLMHNELECLRKEHEKAAQQRNLAQRERQHVAEEVDAVTAECLALREQLSIYEAQLANMEAQHKTAAERLLESAEGTTQAAAAIKFGSPAMTAALDVKEYYCQLAESLQCDAAASAVVYNGDAKQRDVRRAARSTVKDLPKTTDTGDLKMLISELHKELAELEKRNEELEDKAEMKKAAYMDEIAELEYTIAELQHREDSFQTQIKEQCEDYKVLLGEKMARDMEIAAYRSLVEEEEARLCNL